jgi:hypothetical protein
MANGPERSSDAISKIFGDALRQKAAEDRDDSFPDDSDHERWLRENTPPHHL